MYWVSRVWYYCPDYCPHYPSKRVVNSNTSKESCEFNSKKEGKVVTWFNSFFEPWDLIFNLQHLSKGPPFWLCHCLIKLTVAMFSAIFSMSLTWSPASSRLLPCKSGCCNITFWFWKQYCCNYFFLSLKLSAAWFLYLVSQQNHPSPLVLSHACKTDEVLIHILLNVLKYITFICNIILRQKDVCPRVQ